MIIAQGFEMEINNLGGMLSMLRQWSMAYNTIHAIYITVLSQTEK